MKKPIVVIESPLAGDVERNVAYAKAALKDSLMRGESPFASHLLYAQEGVLDDTVVNERLIGMEAGFEFYKAADLCAVYTDLGISSGMAVGIQKAKLSSVEIEMRTIPGWVSPVVPTVKFKRLHPEAKMPQRMTAGSAGADLYAVEDSLVRPGSHTVIKCGFAMQLPVGYEAQVRSRSGLAAKNQISVLNSPGTIDSDYTGEVCVILYNHKLMGEFEVKAGDRIAQMVIQEIPDLKWVEVDSLDETERGSGGFGSSGK